MLLQGVAVLRLQPGQAWVDALQAAVLQQLHRMGPRDISQVCLLCACCVLNTRHVFVVLVVLFFV